ncbi:MAG: DUF4091 domain-containing protein [Kiritimatiellia bacterium]
MDAYRDDQASGRRKAGESFWWYICCSPKAPYPGEFIDRPGTELRVWLWQTFQRGIEGILIWETTYWTSPAAYPDPARPQNPYTDPMSWTSGYGTPSGARRPWGNGDGRFLYPPLAAAEGRPAAPVLEGPVDSIRWEMLRDGLEDYEYLALLRRLLAAHPERAGAPGTLLEVPADITAEARVFTRDPAPLMARRRALAAALTDLTSR